MTPKENITNLLKEKDCIHFVKKADMAKFLTEQLGLDVPSSTKYVEILEMARQHLNADTVLLFDTHLLDFGLLKKDVQTIFDITPAKVNHLIADGKITVKSQRSSKNYRDITYTICSVSDIISLLEEGSVVPKKTMVAEPLSPTDYNLAASLYVINKSAKLSRDTKNQSYRNGDHSSCQSSKTRMNKLYDLKDTCLKKLLAEERLEFLGIHRQVLEYGRECYLSYYRLCDFTFHVPYNGSTKKIDKSLLLKDIDGIISAERTKDVKIKFKEAVATLEAYSGTKLKKKERFF